MSNNIKNIENEVKKVIVGKDQVVRKVLTAILAGGHILLDDIPGVGKTTLALSFSKAMGLEFNRVQFTPDVVPSDITGFSMYNKEKGDFEYKAGAAMCNFLLADEINRTSSKTQSSLLEVMQEGKITVDGITHNVPTPFVVIATQNPIGSAGTQMLPEAQLDRFMIEISMGYPSKEAQINILKDREKENPIDKVEAVIGGSQLEEAKEQVRQIYIDDKILAYITDLVEATRDNKYIRLGVSPRGAMSLMNMAKAYAFIDEKDFVTPEHVRAVIKEVFRHRILLSGKAQIEDLYKDDVLESIIEEIKAPVI